mmetsp:Transcript_32570/g.29425  ORF Transcript_32570/g.29425 Transcript_32570/m.29425 type:complete len:293 (+) Transcript_32570:166-1044(+)
MEQKLDHFDSSERRTFKQRYYSYDQFYHEDRGNIFLYVCGEAACGGVPVGSYPTYLGIQKQGLVFALEHRYYGESLPLGKDSLTDDNLKWLTIDNALEDLASFIEYANDNKTTSKISPNAKWIIIGGSYSGAVSAWFREKYPHLVVGSWASSPVIHPILNFTDFDRQIYLSSLKSGIECPTAVQNVTKYLEKQLYNYGPDHAKETKLRFSPFADKLNNEEFLWYFADTIVLGVQYGHRTELCDILMPVAANMTNLWETTIRYFNSVENDPRDYGSHYLSDPTPGDGGRQWYY